MMNKFSRFLSIFILFTSVAFASQDDDLRQPRQSPMSDKSPVRLEAERLNALNIEGKRLLEESAAISKKLKDIEEEQEQLINETNQLVSDNIDLHRALAQASLKLERLKKQNSKN